MDQSINMFLTSATGNPNDFLYAFLAVPVVVVIITTLIRPLF